MGTYYTLGVIKNFSAESGNVLSDSEWNALLNEKIDTELFNITIKDKNVSGSLKDDIFTENIEDFYRKLKEITHDPRVDYYFKGQGVDINEYSTADTCIRINEDKNRDLVLRIEYILLFIEGKVSVEAFSIEPKLMNWLFRHCNFGNPLAGCIISDICG